MSDKIDIWEWTHADQERFRAEGGTRAAIIDHYEEFWRCYHDDPLGAELAIHHAIEAAKACDEPRWELHLRHWRIQNWVSQSQVRRMLPEAVDLLDLAVDERVKDVPQRICAYHDVVECYVEIDPAGYSQEIKENSEHILSQLPRRYPCADCARSNLARAAAAAGKVQEAEHWLAEGAAYRHDAPTASSMSGRGHTYIYLEQWDNAEHAYLESSKLAQKEEDGVRYLWALLGIARARLGKGDLAGAQQVMPHVRRNAKYEGSSNLIAEMLKVEGYMAEQHNAPQAALDYFTRSAKIFEELGCSRDAAEIALHAVEMAREHQLTETTAVLAIAARAVGELPPASHDLYERLAALGVEPVVPTASETTGSPETAEQLRAEEERKELADLEEILHAHLQNGLFQGITSALFRLGVWYDSHDQTRAALDYFIWAAALERLRRFPGEERQDALHAFKVISSKLPEGSINAALRAAESAPPTQLMPMLTHLPIEQWQWTLQAIATEITGKPVVEPEPENKDRQARFEEWAEHCASMSALIVRFYARLDPDRYASWITSLTEIAQEWENAAGEQKDQPGHREIISFVRGMAELGQGSPVAEVAEKTYPPFKQTIEQIGEIAALPVWQHPGNAPLDFMIEQAAQKTVRALRIHDSHRATRLANLALRYELMTLDMREHEELNNGTRFLAALCVLLRGDGQLASTSEPALEEPFASILQAVAQAGLEPDKTGDETEDE